MLIGNNMLCCDAEHSIFITRDLSICIFCSLHFVIYNEINIKIYK